MSEGVRIEGLEGVRLPISERAAVVSGIISDTLLDIDTRYGLDGQNPKYYHGPEHTRDVLGAASELTSLALLQGLITVPEAELVQVVMAGHDNEQDLGPWFNEAESSRLIRSRMTATGLFSDSELVRADKMTMGTCVNYEDGVLRQMASDDDILALLVADADLAALGRPPYVYWDRALKLLRERGGETEPRPEELARFAELQSEVLRGHEFHTNLARVLFPNKQANIRLTEERAEFWTDVSLGKIALSN